MPTSTTTSVRLPNPLRAELERQALARKRGKNWIIKEALEQYFNSPARDALGLEARRQSETASRRSPRDADWGDRGGDIDGWRE